MPTIPPPPSIHGLGLLRSFLAILIPLLLLLIGVITAHYFLAGAAEADRIRANEQLNADIGQRVIEADISGIATDLMFLADHIERQHAVDIRDEAQRQLVTDLFLSFAANKRLYDQVRYLDADGREAVRINYNQGIPRTVPRPELQNKSERYYFRSTIALGRGEIYLSPLDLNIESETIERPFKPMLRLGTPVFDRNARKRGAVILNFFGENMIRHFRQATAGIANHVALLDGNGYWLAAPDAKDEWGFMLNRKERTFAAHNPAAWQKINTADEGQFQSAQGLYTWTTVYPLRTAIAGEIGRDDARLAEYRWKVVAHLTPAILSASRRAFLYGNALLYSGALALLVLGSLVGAIAHVRHKWADARREYEQMFRHILENIQLAAVGIDLAGKVQFCNAYFLNLAGCTRAESLKTDWFTSFVTVEQRDEARAHLLPASGIQDAPVDFECRIQPKSGSARTISWNTTVTVDAAGHAVGLTLIGEDVTEQRETQSQLAKLSQVVEQSPSIVIITGRDGFIEYVNPKFTEVTGYEAAEVIGRNPRILKSGERTTEEYAQLWQTIIGGRVWRGDMHNRKKNGELYWDHSIISPIRDSTGQIAGFFAVKEDITERKRLQAEVELRNHELARNETLAAMGRMASMIAHDLRNPLSSIKMAFKIIGKHPDERLSQDTRELQAIGLEQIRYMENILSDLLSYSKPDALNPEWVALDKLLDAAIGIARKAIDDPTIEIATHYQTGLPTIHADATKLRRAFINLVTNAAQARAETHGTTYRITVDTQIDLAHEGPCVRVTVSDEGSGIPPEDREKIFDPFFTTHATGTGLGLPIVKRILEQHGGSIRLEPNSPRGTCAVVVLPLRLAQQPAAKFSTESTL